MSLSSVIQDACPPCLWTLLSCAGIVGFVALISPKTFHSIATKASQWLDSEKVLARLDQRIDIDRILLPYSRFLGAAVLASVAILSFRLSVH